MTTISLHRVSRAHRSCTIRSIPLGPGVVQTSALFPPTPPTLQNAYCNKATCFRGVYCGKRLGHRHGCGDFYQLPPVTPADDDRFDLGDEWQRDLGDEWQRDLGGEG